MNLKSTPKFSIIIPARDEEVHLPSCLESIKRSFAEIPDCEFEIIVVLNRCTDKTEEIALNAGCTTIKDESKNLSMIRNAGAKASRGDILVTVDADSRVSVGTMKAILKVMDSGIYVGGGVMIYPERWSVGIIACGALVSLLAAWYQVTAGLFFMSRQAFFGIGGFDEARLTAEDIDFARRLKKFGKNSGLKFKNLFSAYIVTSCRKFDKLGDWYFFKRLPTMLRLLKGKDEKAANEIWYDFPRN